VRIALPQHPAPVVVLGQPADELERRHDP
jgi:hypothetical protein